MDYDRIRAQCRRLVRYGTIETSLHPVGYQWAPTAWRDPDLTILWLDGELELLWRGERILGMRDAETVRHKNIPALAHVTRRLDKIVPFPAWADVEHLPIRSGATIRVVQGTRFDGKNAKGKPWSPQKTTGLVTIESVLPGVGVPGRVAEDWLQPPKLGWGSGSNKLMKWVDINDVLPHRGPLTGR